MTRPQPLPPELAGRPFSTATALKHGVNPERLRRGDLAHPFQGVNAPARSGHFDPCRAFATKMPDHSVFSHVSAARLWGIPLPSRLEHDSRLHVATTQPFRALRTRGVVGHTLELLADEISVVNGMPVTSPSRTWRDLAPLVSVEDLVCIGDRLLWWRKPIATREELRVAINRGFHGRGIKRLRVALPALSDRSDSIPESVFRWRFAVAGLPHAAPNLELRKANGTFLAMPDLTFVKFKEVFDYEGDHHRTDSIQWQKDIARVPRLEEAGWHSNRGSAADLRDSTELIARLARSLQAKGWRP